MATPKYHLDTFDPQTAGVYSSHTLQVGFIPPESNVLELGCASGYMSAYLEHEKHCQVTGLDFDADAIEIARTRSSEAHVVDLDAPDALEIARANAPYDIVYAANVLEHLRFPERLLQNAHDLLHDQGQVVIALPNIANWRFRLKLLFGQFDYTDYGVMDRTHTRLYTVKSGRSLLANCGFNITNFMVAGSFVQNALMRWQWQMKLKAVPVVLPGLLGYELIYVARKSSGHHSTG